jgi:hypothetical protein
MRMLNVGADSAGNKLMLEISVDESSAAYVPDNSLNNALLPSGLVGAINVRVPYIKSEPPLPDDTIYSVALRFTVLDQKTELPVKQDVFGITLFDFDQGADAYKTQECAIIHDATMISLTDNTELTEEDLGGGRMKYCSSTEGVGSDNPLSPVGLTDQQRARSISMIFADSDHFVMEYTVGCCGWGGRNMLFTAPPIDLADNCPSQPPPPPPPPPPPTSPAKCSTSFAHFTSNSLAAAAAPTFTASITPSCDAKTTTSTSSITHATATAATTSSIT